MHGLTVGELGEIIDLIGDADMKKLFEDLEKTGPPNSKFSGKFTFPFLESPSEVFGLLMGKPATLVGLLTIGSLIYGSFRLETVSGHMASAPKLAVAGVHEGDVAVRVDE